jgi:gamma-glutamyltranspeptidase/glutathione hydrolase
MLLMAAAALWSAGAGAQTATWRPVLLADHGMVASGHPLASEAGVRILKAGGNAVDAAIAAWAVQGVVEPMMTGFGGVMFALIYLAKTGEVKFVNGSGPAPMAATIDLYKAKGGIPASGPLSVSVPGAVGGAELALRTFGTRSLKEVLQPAIELAEAGFPVTEHLARSLVNDRKKLAQFPSTTRIWFRDGEPYPMGERVTQRELGATLRRIGAEGSRGFYHGTVARATAAYLKANGGIVTESDLAAFRAHEDTAIHVPYRGLEVYECPPNSQGHVMLQALRLVEPLDLRALGHNSAPYLHAVVESLKLAFADRNRFVGDPRVVPAIPMKELLSKEYADRRRALIRPDRAIEGEASPGDPRQPVSSASAVRYRGPFPELPPGPAAEYHGVGGVGEADPSTWGFTTYLAVVDKDRNMVSITSSILSTFGSGMVVEDAGYFLNNRMAYFYLDPQDVNALAPGKRTRQTINPAIALKDGKPFVVFGTPGADTQPQAQLQFLLNLVDFGMNVQQALEASSVVSTGFRASYYPHEIAGKLQVPATLPREVLDGLTARGHVLDVRNMRGVGSVKAIQVHAKSNALMGGVSPTGDSYVMGW